MSGKLFSLASILFCKYVKEGEKMTIYEASERYNIPIEILKLYESWNLCSVVKDVMDEWQYDDTDLERLSLIMALHDIGFSNQEIESYMRLLLEDNQSDISRLKILDKKRDDVLRDIHIREKQLQRLDYLRYHIRKEHSK